MDDLRDPIAHEHVVQLARHLATVKRGRLRASAARSRKSTTTVVMTRASGALPARANLADTPWRKCMAEHARMYLVLIRDLQARCRGEQQLVRRQPITLHMLVELT